MLAWEVWVVECGVLSVFAGDETSNALEADVDIGRGGGGIDTTDDALARLVGRTEGVRNDCERVR